MAKKTSMNKGYRKAEKKKPFLTKKDIKGLIAFLVGVLVVVILFNLLYDDGYLGAKEVQPNDLVYYAEKELRNRFIHLGTVNELEGFTIEEKDETGKGVTLRRNFVPVEPTENIDYITVSGSFMDASWLVARNYDNLTSGQLTSSVEVTDIQEITVQGYPAYMYSYTQKYYQPEEGAEVVLTESIAASQEPNTFTQAVCTFINMGPGRTACMYIYFDFEDGESFHPADQAESFVNRYSAAFTLDQPAEK